MPDESPSPPQAEALDTLDSLLCAALDGPDARRIALLTSLCLMRRDIDRDADFDRLRREGTPPVFLA